MAHRVERLVAAGKENESADHSDFNAGLAK
jgi:hypothetical protein